MQGVQLKDRSSISSLTINAQRDVFVLQKGRALVWSPDATIPMATENNSKIILISPSAQALVGSDTECLTIENDELKLYDFAPVLICKKTIKLPEGTKNLCSSSDSLHSAVITPKGFIHIWNNLQGECVCTFNGLSEKLVLQFGLTPRDIVGIAFHQESAILRQWKWQEPLLHESPVQHALPAWMESFILLGRQIHKANAEEAWGPYCVLAEKDPHTLLDLPDFLQQLTTPELRAVFKAILEEYARDFYYHELSTIFQQGPQTYKPMLERGIKMLEPVLKGGDFKTPEALGQRKQLENLRKRLNELSKKQSQY